MNLSLVVGRVLPFEITEADLKLGLKQDLTKRPVAYALRRAFAQFGTVEYVTTYIMAANLSVEERNGQIVQKTYVELQLSVPAARFTEKFDEGQRLMPGIYEATITVVERETE